MRIPRLVEAFGPAGLDAYIVAREANIYYLTGSTSGGVLLVTSDEGHLLLAPKVNRAIAEAQASGCEVEAYPPSRLPERIAEVLGDRRPRVVGFDDLSRDLHQRLEGVMGGVEFRASAELVWRMRRVKDAEELRLMGRAGELAEAGMRAVAECLRPGLREHEVAAEAAYAMMRGGGEGLAFPINVASGPRSAYPHAGVSDRAIERGDLVTVDMGATYREYRSDITRTFVVGEPSRRQVELYETVLAAYEAAARTIRDGARACDADRAARSVIREAGHAENFVHSLGHGVGLEIHEPPSLGETSDEILRAGNVVTCEPGVYIVGQGGVRIEDALVVTSSEPGLLTNFERSLEAVVV